MQHISRSKKYQNGIRVFWADERSEFSEFFSYDDLVERQINALDLLNNPGLYLVNSAGHQIESAASGCSFSSKTCENEILITRLLDGSRDLAWKVWTEPEFIMQWWGPKHFSSPSCRIDCRVGGTYLYCMRSPEGRDYWSTGRFREVKAPERIVCTDSFADENGTIVPPAYYGMSPEIPPESLITVVFEGLTGQTRLTLRHAGFPPGEQQDLARAGWNESLDKYAGILARLQFAGPGAASAATGGERPGS